MNTRTLSALLCLSLTSPILAAPSPASLGVPVIIIDKDLNVESANLLSIQSSPSAGASNQLTFLDSRGQKLTRPLSSVVAITAPESHPFHRSAPLPEESSPWLELADGQRLLGSLNAAPTQSGKDPAVAFNHAHLGSMSIPLDLVSRYVGVPSSLDRALARPLSTAADTVVTLNDDRVEGVLEQLGQTIVIAPPLSRDKSAPATAATSIPAQQVVLVNLFTKRTPPKGPTLALADGSIQTVLELSLEKNQLTFTPTLGVQDGKKSSSRENAAELLGFTPDAARFAPLASIPIAAQAIDPSRVFGDPARIDPDPFARAPLGLRDIHLPGPMTVEWTISPNALAIGGVIQLEDGARAWGDCTVIISIASAKEDSSKPERVLERARLNADTPRSPFRAKLDKLTPGDRLRVRVEPGENGSIQDRVVIRRGLVLLGTTAAPAR